MLWIINLLGLITIWITQVSCFSFSFPGQYQGAFGFAFGSSRALAMGTTTAIWEGKPTANSWGPAKFLLSSRPFQECNRSWYKSWWILESCTFFYHLDSGQSDQASLGRVPGSRPGIPLSYWVTRHQINSRNLFRMPTNSIKLIRICRQFLNFLSSHLALLGLAAAPWGK